MHFYLSIRHFLMAWLQDQFYFISTYYSHVHIIQNQREAPGYGDTLLHAFCDSPIEKNDDRLQTKTYVITIFCLSFLLCWTKFRLFIRLVQPIVCSICLSRQIFRQAPSLPHSKTLRPAGFYKKQCFIYVILWKNNYIPFLKNTEDNEIKKWEFDNVCCTPFWTVFSATKNSTIR